MRNDGLINETEIRKAITQLKPDGELFEVRIMGGRQPISGYFRDADTLIEAFSTVDLRNTNVYITLNKPLDALYSRQQADRFLSVKNTTSDKEIEVLNWLFVDLDPVRPSGISSTNEELRESMELAQKVYVYLKGVGFEEPVKAFSGNGYHLLYRIGLACTEENEKLVKGCLKALSAMFSTDAVKVDTANFNPSRICKLYGTMAQKGSDTESRPHRMAKIDGDVKDLKQTKKIYLEKLAGEIEEEEIRPEKYNNYSPHDFDIETWMNEHGIGYTTKAGDGYTKYILDECPFDANHKAPDSMILKQPSGAIGFKCLHDSCQGKRWQDVRVMFEPDAYDKANESFDRAIEEGWRRHNRDKKKKEINVENGAIWETPLEINKKPTPDSEYIKTHIGVIDKKTHGLMKGGLSVWSGLRGSAKSTILSQIALQAVNDNHNVLFYSGELTDKRFVRWLFQQAAGKQYVKEVVKDESQFWFVPDDIKQTIAEWIGSRLYIYNNSYGSEYNKLMQEIETQIQKVKPDLVILDNLMTINVQEVDVNEYRAQTTLMIHLAELAKQYNCHVALVAHPRKTATFLRLLDISGSSNISNLVDSAFIVHRVNHDFKKGYIDEFCKKGTKEEDVTILQGASTNVIEIAKDREAGIQDEFIPLWYEKESRRMLNEKTEVIKFKWTTEWMEHEAEADFMNVDDMDDIPFDD
ncbi:MAG: AAA family ATPase [Clostridiales bacterium]|nr:AAA family ATPase [Clostridiales bacterium]